MVCLGNTMIVTILIVRSWFRYWRKCPFLLFISSPLSLLAKRREKEEEGGTRRRTRTLELDQERWSLEDRRRMRTPEGRRRWNDPFYGIDGEGDRNTCGDAYESIRTLRVLDCDDKTFTFGSKNYL
ncbi:hypothetical protein L6452_03580 [Arctium lappa]|uniref:Uncharacterized protein n=1 Tax=Arctium lappa TaxID=4217 RepID=A0ACB9FML6_ARCLA|nr:hypothetical protein L6452_03580 [Arctium lappa]